MGGEASCGAGATSQNISLCHAEDGAQRSDGGQTSERVRREVSGTVCGWPLEKITLKGFMTRISEDAVGT